MYKPLYLFIGQRYIRAKKRNHFISFISLSSMLGIALGVMVLITVLSVMNGFSREIRNKMLSVNPHITIRNFDGPLSQWQAILAKLKDNKHVKGAAPYILSQGMLAYQGHVQPVIVRGVEPTMINQVFPISQDMLAGSLDSIDHADFHILIGVQLAHALNVEVGSQITMLVPEPIVSPIGVTPRLKRFIVGGIFETGTYYDHKHAFINLHDSAKVFKIYNGVTGIDLKLFDELAAREVSNEINELLDYQYQISNWTRDYGSLFEAIKMEKTVMWCILILIIAVAAFNLVSSLVMVVTDKHKDIAILRTMGASPRTIMMIFITQGAIVGLIGVFLGLISGVILASNVTMLVNLIQEIFSVSFINEDVYLIGFVPSELRFYDVSLVCLLALVMSLLATIYPAYKASKIQPAEALRYE
jgi:lipoprotein-releasing system permease protein